jgi:hypothetical protein
MCSNAFVVIVTHLSAGFKCENKIPIVCTRLVDCEDEPQLSMHAAINR